MSASSAYLGEYAPGYKITKRGPAALAKTFDAAIADKQAKGENYTSFGYGDSSPQKSASPEFASRFAGDVLIGGINGEFGSVTNNKKNPNQENLKIWTQQFASGPFSPFGPPPPTGAPAPGTEETA